MPQNKQKTPLDRIMEASGIKYYMELIDCVKAKTKHKEKDKDYQDYFWSVYWFEKTMRSLRDKPTCQFQSYYYMVSNPSSDTIESRKILSFQEYREVKKNLDLKVKKGEIKIERIIICNTRKISKKATDSIEQKTIYGDKNFHCPCRSLKFYEDEITYFRDCNRPEISLKMKEFGVDSVDELRQKMESDYNIEAIVNKLCKNESLFEIFKFMYKQGLSRQAIEQKVGRAKEIIEKTKSQ